MQRISLNSQQQSAVTEPNSVLVLSGAGTGKTRVLTARISHLLENNVLPEQILAMTYTNKAAGEMRSRLSERSNSKLLTIGTFHSICARILRNHSAETGLPTNYRILDTNDQTAIIRRIMRDNLEQKPVTQGGPEPRKIRDAINKLKDKGIRASDAEYHLAEKLVTDTYKIYEKNLREEGKADFAELILLCIEIFNNHPKVREQWSQRYSHILVDELQDISTMQLDWLELLKNPTTIYFGVGDDDQSIYGFRGADPKLLDRFCTKLANGKILRLEKNYRSTEKILGLANAVIASNQNRLGKKLIATCSKGDIPTYSHYTSAEKEATETAIKIRDAISDGVKPSEIAVLFRNHVISQLIEQELVDLGIPYKVRGGQRFFERKEIKTAISYLVVAANQNDEEAILRSINEPKRGIGPALIKKLKASTDENLWIALQQTTDSKVKKYVDVIELIKTHVEQGDLIAAVKAAVNDSGLVESYENKLPLETEKIECLRELENVMLRFTSNEGVDLNEFLELSSLESDQGVELADEQVSLMTIHASKGLEFDYVFVMALEEGILPPESALNNPSQLAEERRLMYVAITRSKTFLKLSCAQYRHMHGKFLPMRPTPLIRNLKSDILQQVTTDKYLGSNGKNYFNNQHRQPMFAGSMCSKIGNYRVGTKVSHQKFGKGVILSLLDSSEGSKVHVQFFGEYGRKWLRLNLAKLQTLQ